MAITVGLTDSEEQCFIDLCTKLGQPVSHALFNALAAKFVLVGLETVIWRRRPSGLEVLLTQRPANDANWPGFWHSPGVMLRATDAPKEVGVPCHFESAFYRAEAEIGANFSSWPRFAGINFIRGRRGPNVCLIFACQISGSPARGQFFPTIDLPEPLVEGHLRIIEQAIRGV